MYEINKIDKKALRVKYSVVRFKDNGKKIQKTF